LTGDRGAPRPVDISPAHAGESLVGLIVNPRSGQDIRRLVAPASVFPNTEKVLMLQRVVASLGAVGVRRVVAAVDQGGIAAGLARAADARDPVRDPSWPQIELLHLLLTGGPADSIAAADALLRLGAGVLVVVGGDGTVRLVASAAGDVPLAPVSTGTNNAFMPVGESTIVGLAAGLLATGALAPVEACRHNKVLVVEHGPRRELALVDVAVLSSSAVGSRAVWHPSELTELFVAFAEPEAVGLSSIAGLVQPVGRDDPIGLRLALHPGASRRVLAPIAPGLVREVGVAAIEPLDPGTCLRVTADQGVVAVDGEREIEFRRASPTVTLSLTGPVTIDVARTMRLAATRGLLDRR
jgi:predicted polyphosphate/ATP-dependent NAD kinase